MERPEVLLFDVGGVLVELGGLGLWERWRGDADHGRSVDERWTAWLTSPSVRRFESGACGPEAFARGVIAEFGLEVPVEEFMGEFAAFPKAVLPGARELLRELSHRRLACFSNTNALHWPIMMGDFGLVEHFERAFASHELGLLKPDRAAFERIVSELEVEPARILFLDDARLNVEGARVAGLQAEQVQGPDEARAALERRGIL